jgi:DNA-binding transcriptional regulator YdaS (Cro superfamily)
MFVINGITEACMVAGSQAQLARDLGISQQSANKWARMGYVPLHHVPEVSRRYGVARERLIKPSLLVKVPDDLTDGE